MSIHSAPTRPHPAQNSPGPKPTSRHKTYFFSDAHLGLGSRAEDRQKEQRIIQFLDYVKRDAEQLFIIGDLFDYWFEYKTVVPKGYFRLFAKIAELTDRGIHVTYVVGNHDFWIKEYFHDELGIDIQRDPIEREIHGRKFFIHHGDGLLKSDRGYRLLKRILRNRLCIILFSLVHPDLTGQIARWSSRKSRQYASARRYEGSDMVDFAAKKLRDGYDYVVMGHNHAAQFRHIGRGFYVNLGDWIFENSFAVFDGRRLELRRWKPSR